MMPLKQLPNRQVWAIVHWPSKGHMDLVYIYTCELGSYLPVGDGVAGTTSGTLPPEYREWYSGSRLWAVGSLISDVGFGVLVRALFALV